MFQRLWTYRSQSLIPKSQMEFAINKVKALPVDCPRLFACLAYRLTLNMEDTCFSRTSVNSYLTTPHHIPEDSTLQSKNYSATCKTLNIVDGTLLILIKIHYLYINCEILCYIKCRNLTFIDINLWIKNVSTENMYVGFWWEKQKEWNW
jgi:hypothetical protein